MNEVIFLQKLDTIIKLLESHLIVSDKLFKLMNQYNSEYIADIEKDDLVGSGYSEHQTENYEPKKLKKVNNL